MAPNADKPNVSDSEGLKIVKLLTNLERLRPKADRKCVKEPKQSVRARGKNS